MKIATWNVNGIRARQAQVLEWIGRDRPDVVCLQEIKAAPEQVPEALRSLPDYWCCWHGERAYSGVGRGYSGVAIYSLKGPRSVRQLGIGEFDDEGRYLEADFGDLTVVSAYFPNSQEAGASIDYKLRFCDAILARCDSLRAKGRHVVVSGDYNIAHKAIDLARPDQNEGNPGYLPAERAWMDRFTGAGYIDSLRRFDPSPGLYTWWTYRVSGARERNVGWRLDYHCVDPGLAPELKGAAIHPAVLGSDHCPVSIELRE